MNTPNATLGIVMIKADTTIIAADKEALLKHLRKPKEYSVLKSIYIFFLCLLLFLWAGGKNKLGRD